MGKKDIMTYSVMHVCKHGLVTVDSLSNQLCAVHSLHLDI